MVATTTTTYGFVGLGQMGHGMAKNLRKKLPESSLLVIYDINDAAVTSFVNDFGGASNIITARSPREVSEHADVVMTSVPRAPHVEDVFLNPSNGLLSFTPTPTRRILFLELSTIDSKVSSQIAKRVATEGYGDFVDAPCSGGAMGAEKGTLSFMIGCPVNLYPRVFEICKLMGKESGIFHCGDLGAGLQTKLLNNYLSSLTALATAETINIGIRGGLDGRKLNEVINSSSGMNFNSITNNPVPGLTPGNAASKGYVGGFSIELCLGVLELAVKSAEDIGAKTVLGGPMLNAYREVEKIAEYKGKDSKVIYKWLDRQNPAL